MRELITNMNGNVIKYEDFKMIPKDNLDLDVNNEKKDYDQQTIVLAMISPEVNKWA